MNPSTLSRTFVAFGLVAAFASGASAQDWESGDPGAGEPAEQPRQRPAGGGTTGESGGAPAEAEPLTADGLETVYATRGITLGKGTLRIDVGPYERSLNNSGTILGTFSYGAYGARVQRWDFPVIDDQTHAVLGIGAAYGILDELEVGALLAPVIMAPDGDFGDMAVYGRYAFLRTEAFELGAQLALSLPTGTEDFGIGVGLPFSVRLVERLRIEGGVEFEALVGPGDDWLSLDIPLAVSYNVLDPLFVGAQTGILIPDFDGVIWPIGPFVGYTLALDSAALDFTGAFTWLVGDNEPTTWELVFGVNVHLGVGPS